MMLMLAAGQGHGLSWNDVVGERDLDAISADAERVRLAEADAALDADGDAGRDVDALSSGPEKVLFGDGVTVELGGPVDRLGVMEAERVGERLLDGVGGGVNVKVLDGVGSCVADTVRRLRDGDVEIDGEWVVVSERVADCVRVSDTVCVSVAVR